MVGDTQACLPRGMSGSIDEMSTSRNTPITRPDASAERINGCVNWPLVPLRISLFLFFGGELLSADRWSLDKMLIMLTVNMS
jgi:hypothetical protein